LMNTTTTGSTTMMTTPAAARCGLCAWCNPGSGPG